MKPSSFYKMRKKSKTNLSCIKFPISKRKKYNFTGSRGALSSSGKNREMYDMLKCSSNSTWKTDENQSLAIR